MEDLMKVGILLFNEVEVLDFAGPFEVFSITEQESGKSFEVFTVAENLNPIRARNGLTVIPEYSFSSHPDIDILIIPGGFGAEEVEIRNPILLEWIRLVHPQTTMTASVCTGAFLLAEAGLLNGLEVTTHWMDQERLQREYPFLSVVKDQKFVDQKDIITSGGISAGIEMSLHIVKRFFGIEIALRTAKRMEYSCAIR